MVVINLEKILDWLNSLVDKFLNMLYSVLPASPLSGFISKVSGSIPRLYIAYLNWFVPVKEILIVFAAFLSSLALYYIYSVVMRWIKLIG